jgi:hypothetical protein
VLAQKAVALIEFFTGFPEAHIPLHVTCCPSTGAEETGSDQPAIG